MATVEYWLRLSAVIDTIPAVTCAPGATLTRDSPWARPTARVRPAMSPPAGTTARTSRMVSAVAASHRLSDADSRAPFSTTTRAMGDADPRVTPTLATPATPTVVRRTTESESADRRRFPIVRSTAPAPMRTSEKDSECTASACPANWARAVPICARSGLSSAASPASRNRSVTSREFVVCAAISMSPASMVAPSPTRTRAPSNSSENPMTPPM